MKTMRKKLFWIGWIFSVSLLWGGNDAGMQLLSPSSLSVYHEQSASVVVKVTSAAIEKIVITAEMDQRIDIVPVQGRNTYCKTIRLLSGENKVFLSAIGKEGEIGKLSTNIYHDIVTEKKYRYPPENYLVQTFHLSSNEKRCVPCHKMEVNEIQGVAFENPSDSNCYGCHQKLTGRSHGHAPAINWLCTSCHQIQKGGEYRFKLPEKIGEACLDCHKKEKESWEAKQFHHMPFDAKQCTRCHNPHSGEERFFLRAKSWDLCTSCHADKINGNHILNTIVTKIHPTRGKPDPSRPGKELECISCHNPHASNTRSLIVGSSPMSICVKCHKK